MNRKKEYGEKEEQRVNINKNFKTYEVRQKILAKNHSLSIAMDKEIKKLFNIYLGTYIINVVISKNTVVIDDPIFQKTQIVNVPY